MEPSTSPSAPDRPKFIILRGFWTSLQFIIVIAFFIATLFSAWTPGESSDPTTLEMLNFDPIPTPLPTAGPTSTPRQRPLIGIVAGHSGNDSGAVCIDGLTEADVNLNIATLVQKQLTDLGFDVDLLKEFDPRLNGYQASTLISIHADSCDFINSEATGYKVAAALSNPNPDAATQLTACLRSRYASATGLPLHSTSVTRDMTDYHAFNEIDNNTVAAIIETGFLNLDRTFLTQTPELAAKGIVDGILCYIRGESVLTPTTP
jgi:N-acetylmuramoyl-L-alanine amidase